MLLAAGAVCFWLQGSACTLVLGMPQGSTVLGMPQGSTVLGMPQGSTVLGMPQGSTVLGMPQGSTGTGLAGLTQNLFDSQEGLSLQNHRRGKQARKEKDKGGRVSRELHATINDGKGADCRAVAHCDPSTSV